MKFERINDHQIRCILSRADLADRQVKISELEYGTDKARLLFRDMLEQASFELGFEADNIPLLIEAIPLPSDSVLLVITKVEDPDELDTRFANFAPSILREEDSDLQDVIKQSSDALPAVLDLFKKLSDEVTKNSDSVEDSNKEKAIKSNTSEEIMGTFTFTNLNEVIKACGIISKFFKGTSSLYRNENDGEYVLIVSKGEHTTEEFNRVCNVLSEYGEMEKSNPATLAYYVEHGDCLISEHAIETLLA